jgi:hypothetical protein
MSGNFKSRFESTFGVFIEGTHRGLPANTELLEFRMDGPMRKQPSRNYFILDIEINLLVRSFMDDTDFHKMRRSCGEVATWLAKNHCIYRYGDGPDDDNSLLGVLQLKNRTFREPVRVNHFGQIDPQYQLEEATVEASFQMHLSEQVDGEVLIERATENNLIFIDESVSSLKTEDVENNLVFLDLIDDELIPA